jgi:hypothetical protein
MSSKIENGHFSKWKWRLKQKMGSMLLWKSDHFLSGVSRHFDAVRQNRKCLADTLEFWPKIENGGHVTLEIPPEIDNAT